MSRPTSAAAVEADLKARADFRGINEAGQVHYLLGMCQQMLAQANTEIERLDATVLRLEEKIERLETDLDAVPDHRSIR
jgi:cell division protein FtsB